VADRPAANDQALSMHNNTQYPQGTFKQRPGSNIAVLLRFCDNK
jgi:hypothetical protein